MLRLHPRIAAGPTAQEIADARAWLLEAAAIDGVEPTPANLAAIAAEHAAVIGGDTRLRMLRDALLIAAR